MLRRTRYRPPIDSHTLAKLAKPSHTTHNGVNPDLSSGGKDHASSLTAEESIGGAPSAAPDGSEELPAESERSSARGREALQDLLRDNPVTIANPFVSWYAGKHKFHKEDLVHANFGRVARALSKTTQLDRERLAWFEYWLEETKEKPELVVHKYADSGDEEDEEAGREDETARRKQDISSNRPDVRDVWDLVEDRASLATPIRTASQANLYTCLQLDALLQLFDYQDSRREFLTLLARIHDASHSGHKYPNKSASVQSYAELSPIHEHGGSEEMGGSPLKSEKQRRKDTHESPARRVGQDRLHFAADIRRRMDELNRMPPRKQAQIREDKPDTSSGFV